MYNDVRIFELPIVWRLKGSKKDHMLFMGQREVIKSLMIL
jgi:hypothetical protein